MSADTTHAADRLRRLRRISRVARLMDTAIRVPGTGIRFGADSVVGLIPGIGDAGGAVIALWIVNEARRLGMPNAKILGNVGIDVAVGSVPLLGDIFDVVFKANRRNLDLILDHFGEEHLMAEVDPDRPMKDITPKRSR